MNNIKKKKERGKDKAKGLNVLVEKFCSKTILKRKTNIAGAKSDPLISIWAGDAKRANIKIKNHL